MYDIIATLKGIIAVYTVWTDKLYTDYYFFLIKKKKSFLLLSGIS